MSIALPVTLAIARPVICTACPLPLTVGLLHLPLSRLVLVPWSDTWSNLETGERGQEAEVAE